MKEIRREDLYLVYVSRQDLVTSFCEYGYELGFYTTWVISRLAVRLLRKQESFAPRSQEVSLLIQ
jgi:hypothetical protein